MPYPRFNKLPVEKRTQLLDIAAQQIVAYAMSFVARGQELGLIRDNVPSELLFD